MNAQHIKSSLNPHVVITAFPGHFATRHSHNIRYIVFSFEYFYLYIGFDYFRESENAS